MPDRGDRLVATLPVDALHAFLQKGVRVKPQVCHGDCGGGRGGEVAEGHNAYVGGDLQSCGDKPPGGLFRQVVIGDDKGVGPFSGGALEKTLNCMLDSQAIPERGTLDPIGL